MGGLENKRRKRREERLIALELAEGDATLGDPTREDMRERRERDLEKERMEGRAREYERKLEEGVERERIREKSRGRGGVRVIAIERDQCDRNMIKG